MAKNRRIGLKTKERFKKTIQNVVIDGLSREIVVYRQDRRTECPNCYYDKVNDRSSSIPKSSPGDPNYFTVGRCPVCRGKGVVTITRKRYIKATIAWNPASDSMNMFVFNEAGESGATRVLIKTDPCHLGLMRDCKSVTIDGIRCVLASAPLVRGLGTKSILVAVFFTEDKPSITSGEFL